MIPIMITSIVIATIIAHVSFKNNKTKMTLKKIIDIIYQAELVNNLELKYLPMTSALDLLIDQIIKSEDLEVNKDEEMINENINAINNYLTPNELILDEKHIRNIATKFTKTKYFDKIKKVINELQLDYSDDQIRRIKNNRDNIVHVAQFIDYDQPLKDINDLRFLIDRIMLKLLGYSGNVINYMNGYKREIIQ